MEAKTKRKLFWFSVLATTVTAGAFGLSIAVLNTGASDRKYYEYKYSTLDSYINSVKLPGLADQQVKNLLQKADVNYHNPKQFDDLDFLYQQFREILKQALKPRLDKFTNYNISLIVQTQNTKQLVDAWNSIDNIEEFYQILPKIKDVNKQNQLETEFRASITSDNTSAVLSKAQMEIQK
ncbi:hypothetical protein ACXYRR_00875 [Mycoplasma sp. 246B]